MNLFQSAFESLSVFKSLESAYKNGSSPVSLTGLSLVHKAHLALALSQRHQKPVLVISPDENEARKICSDINSLRNL